MPSSQMIAEFSFDEENEAEMAAHGISPKQLVQVLDGLYQVRKNRRGRRAAHMVIGRDHQGQCIAIPIVPTYDRRVWRPVTAWYCKPHEWGWLPRDR